MISESRTGWTERYVEGFLGLPLIREFVLRSPQTADRTQREVVDFLILHRDAGILISQKCQEDPSTRTGERAQRWAQKRAREAFSQLRGAVRSPKGRPIWCEHPRRGRVELPDGLPPIAAGIVIVEVFERITLDAELPLEFEGIPLTYLSVNDFLNLAHALRTVPELLTYLEARRVLPVRELTTVGDERVLFEFYLLSDGRLDGCDGRDGAKRAIASQAEGFETILKQKLEADRYSHIVEEVADNLATRHPDYAAGLSDRMVAAFDPPDSRQAYLGMQAILADLRLNERIALGRSLLEAIQNVAGQAQGFLYSSARFDSKPDLVFVLGCSKNVERAELLNRIMGLMRGASAFYEKARCLVIFDRDGVSFEVALSNPGIRTEPTDHALGERFFGRLKIGSKTLALIG